MCAPARPNANRCSCLQVRLRHRWGRELTGSMIGRRGPTGTSHRRQTPTRTSFFVLPGGPCVTLLRHRGRAFADFTARTVVVEARLSDLLRHHTGRRPSPAEAHSWSGSLPILAQDIIDAGLDNVEVLIEHQLPLTSKRVDVILAGRHPRTGAASYVVIELKQWSQATLYDQTGELVTVHGAPGGPRLHPVAQVQRYCDYLVDFTATLHDEARPRRRRCLPAQRRRRSRTESRRLPAVQPRTAVHRSGTREVHQVPPVPAGTRRLRVRRTLIGCCIPPPQPSRQLLTVVADELAAREQFVLLDEQAVAFDLVLHAVEEARASDQKTAVIISGGPGSGKSVIALEPDGRARCSWSDGGPRNRVAGFHPDASRRQRIPKGQGWNGFQVLQLVHGCRAQRLGRVDS